MHILNSFHILISNLLLHSPLVVLSAVSLYLPSLQCFAELNPLFPGCHDISSFGLLRICWDIFSMFSMKEF